MKKKLISFVVLLVLITGVLKSQEMYFPDDINLDSVVNIIVEFNGEPLFYDQSKNITDYQLQFDEFYGDLDSIVQNDTIVKNMQYIANREYYRLLNGVSLSVPLYLKFQIKSLVYVKEIYEDFEVFATLDESIPLLNIDDVWNLCGTGSGIVIAIIDTGIDYMHEALGNGNFPNDKVIGGYDFVNKDIYPMDDNLDGHGTHVAGIVAANSETLKGVAPGASLLAYKVLNASGYGTASDILAGIESSLDPNGDGNYSDHADIVNMSLGSAYGSYNDILSVAVENAIKDFDVVFCIAAGNSSTGVSSDYGNISSPGTSPSAITVGACDKSEQSTMAVFSSKGPSKYINSIKPEIVAPGVDIISCKAGIINGGIENGTMSLSGTSMSTPFISGICALIKQHHTDWNAYQIKSSVISTATLLYDTNNNLYDAMTQGSGRVDAFAAVNNSTFFDRLDIDGNIEGNDLSFGLVNSLELPYSKTIEIRVTNTNANTQNYNINLGTFPDGVNITCSQTSFPLPSNTSTTLTFTLVVSNDVAVNTRIFSGNIFINGDIDGNLHLAWAFIKNRIIWVDDNAIGPLYSGSVSDPKLTIQSAITLSQDYDYIIVKEGSYESFTDYNYFSTIASEFIFNQLDETIDNTIIYTNSNPIIPAYCQINEINGFTIIGNNSQCGIYPNTTDGTLFLKNLKIKNQTWGIIGNTNLNIENVEISNCGQVGQTTFAINVIYKNIIINGLKAHNNNSTTLLSIGYSNSIIENLEVYDNNTTERVIFINSGDHKLNNIKIYNEQPNVNVLHLNVNNLSIENAEIFNTGSIYVNSNNFEVNSLFYHNSKSFVCYKGVINNSIFKENFQFEVRGNVMINNSTIADNIDGYYPIYINNSNLTVKNSIFHNSKMMYLLNSNIVFRFSNVNILYENHQSTISVDGTNISTDPLFSHDIVPYGLSSNSPCINTGDPHSDYQLEPMPHGCRVDMGAYGNTPFTTSGVNEQEFTVLPYQTGFETGSLDQSWQTSGNVTVNTVTGNGANNTNSWLQMSNGTNEAKIFVNLKDTQYPVISFYSKTNGISNPDDGIYFANDCGINPTGFVKVANLPSNSDWTKYLLNIRDLADQNNIEINESFVILYKYTGISTFYSLDEISLMDFPEPELTIDFVCNPVALNTSGMIEGFVYNIHYLHCVTGSENIIYNVDETEYITINEAGCYKFWIEVETDNNPIVFSAVEKQISNSEIIIELDTDYEPGDLQATYTVTITNLTTDVYPSIQLQTVLADDFSFAGSSDFTEENKILTSSVFDLNASSTIELSFTVNILDFSTHDNTTCVDAISGACFLGDCITIPISTGLKVYDFTIEETLYCPNTFIEYKLSYSDAGVEYSLIKDNNTVPIKIKPGNDEPIVFEDTYNDPGIYKVYAAYTTEFKTLMNTIGTGEVNTLGTLAINSDVMGSTVCVGEDATVSIVQPEQNVNYTANVIFEGNTVYTSTNTTGDFTVPAQYLSSLGDYTVTFYAENEFECSATLENEAIIKVVGLQNSYIQVTPAYPFFIINENAGVCLNPSVYGVKYMAYIGDINVVSGTGNGGELCLNIPAEYLTEGLNTINFVAVTSDGNCMVNLSSTAEVCVIDAKFLELSDITNGILEPADYIVKHDLNIESNFSLTMDYCNLYFYPGTKIIVQPGADLIINYSTLAGKIGCMNIPNSWKGIQVLGNYYSTQNEDLQGVLEMNYSTVEDAEIAVQVGGDKDDYKSDGGIVKITNSDFINNQISVQFKPYNNICLNSEVSANKSYINKCNFNVKEGFLLFPKFYIELIKVDGVDLNSNTYKNDFDPYKKVIGIYSTNSSFNVNSYSKPQSYFNNLVYGVYCSGTGEFDNITINGALFENNLQGIYLININNPEITSNIVINSHYHSSQPFGLYLENCTGYKVEANDFSGKSIKEGFGVIIKNSGTSSNEIYHNKFHNLYIGAEVLGINGEKAGLKFICNEFSYNELQIFIDKEANTAYFWGSSSESTGNKFYPDCTDGSVREIFNKGTSEIYYFLDKVEPDAIYKIPECRTKNVYLQGSEFENTCSSKLNNSFLPSGDEIIAKTSEILQKEEFLKTTIDEGNTEQTVYKIITANPGQAQKLKNQLLKNSPWLSDTSLTSTVIIESVLPPVMLRDILRANPRSAKSEKVLEALSKREHPLPKPFLDDIMAGADILSVMEDEQCNLGQLISEKTQLINSGIEYIKNNQSCEATEELLIFFQNEVSIESYLKQMSVYLADNDAVNAQLVFDNIASDFDLTPGQLIEYEKLSDLLAIQTQLINEDKWYLEMSDEQITVIETLAANTNYQAGYYAQSILELINDTIFAPEIVMPDTTQTVPLKSAEYSQEGNTDLSSDTDFMTIYPNPADDYIFITTNLTDYSFSTIEIYDNSGKLVYTENADCETTIDTSDFNSGIYYVKIVIDGKEFESSKLIIE